jgi:hypothetical protein
MKSRAVLLWICVFEVIALTGFFASAWRADSFLPERGGSGDPGAIHAWNSAAGLLFWALVLTWCGCLLLRSFKVRGLGYAVLLIPPYGILGGYFALLVLGL